MKRQSIPRRIIALTTLCLCATAPVSAQLQRFDVPVGSASYSRPEQRIALGLSIPIGGRASAVDRAPRIELRLDRDRVDGQGARLSRFGTTGGAIRISRTLANEPQWLINDRRIARNDTNRSISTVGIIGITLGVVLVAGIVSVAADPPLNDLFEPRN